MVCQTNQHRVAEQDVKKGGLWRAHESLPGLSVSCTSHRWQHSQLVCLLYQCLPPLSYEEMV